MKAPPIRKTRIALVDDDSIITRFMEKVLRDSLSADVEIHSMNDSREAYQWIGHRRCDILISDIEMPGLDGMGMLRAAKNCNPWTRVIFVTAHSTWDRIAEAMETGASDYLLKPLQAQQLVQVVQQECDRVARWQHALRDSLKSPAASK